MATARSKRGAPRERDPGKPRDESKARPVTANEPGSYRRGMTNLSSHIAVARTSATSNTARHAFEIALALAILAVLTGAWLTFFSFVPFDLTPQR